MLFHLLLFGATYNGLSIKSLQLLVVDIESSESVSVLSMLKAEMNLNMCPGSS